MARPDGGGPQFSTSINLVGVRINRKCFRGAMPKIKKMSFCQG
jgi:hypothetical protein